MNTRSLKFRLVAWYAGWLTFLYIIFGIFVYASLEHYLEKSLREALARRVRQVADTVQRSSLNWKVLGEEIQNHFAPEANSRFTRVSIDDVTTYVSGMPADRTFDPGTVPAPPVTAQEESFGRRTLPDGTVLLIVMISRDRRGTQMIVEEGGAVTPMEATLHAWLVILVLGLVLLIVIAILGGFLLVQRAVQPVDQIISKAERISSQSLGERLPVPETHDEFERLSVALNSMIRRLEEAFKHNQRFLADASHELRTPLTIIQGEIEAIVEQNKEKPGVRDTAGSALEEVERLKKIVEGLFALSRLDAGEAQQEFAEVNLAELARVTTDQMCLLAEDRKISIAGHFASPILVRGDRARLKQVLVNLLDNAIKYTPDGGRIEVIVEARNDKAILEVSDNGIGIPDDALTDVFDRFFRVDKARSREAGGAGLGLSIVKSICAAHDGRVEVKSQEGVGSRFIVELPLRNGSST